MNQQSPANEAADHPSLFAFLAARARGATNAHLVANAAVGTTLCVFIAAFRPAIWVLAMPEAVLAAYGAWGLADRALVERPAGPRRTAAVIGRAGALALGVAAALAFVLGALGIALRGWIL